MRRPLPAWVKHGAIFALRGKVYRIISIASTNGRVANHLHFDDYIIAGPTRGPKWSLPKEGSTVASLAESLRELHENPKFFVEDLDGAIHLTSS